MSEYTLKNNLLWFLLAVLVMGAGLALAWSELAGVADTGMGDETAAVVAGQAISRQEIQLAVNGVNRGRRQALSPEQERDMLKRMIDERLLIRYGLDLGLVQDNPNVRKPLVQAVLSMVRANAAEEHIGPGQAEAWFAQHQQRFTQPDQFRLRVYRLEKAGAEENYDQLLAAITQQSALPATAQIVDYVPQGWLPANKLADYLGGGLAAAVQALAQRGASVPFTPAVAGEHYLSVAEIVDYQAGQTAEFAAVKEDVLLQMRRRQGEQALRTLLDDLQEQYQVQVADDWR